jgi:hypothetical protein
MKYVALPSRWLKVKIWQVGLRTCAAVEVARVLTVPSEHYTLYFDDISADRTVLRTVNQE